jgi:hypothetical protein
MRTHVKAFPKNLFIGAAPQKRLADMNIVRCMIAVAESTLPGIPAQRARYLP